jgi:hypothetical protein
MTQLKVKLSNFTTPLTYNEWCQKYQFGVKWDNTIPANKDLIEKIELAKFIQDNPNIYKITPQVPPKKPTVLQGISDFVSQDIMGYFISILS